MSPPAGPGPRPSREAVERELARARGSRRLLPWAALSALGGAAIGLVAGGGPRAGVGLFAAGMVFTLFLWVVSIARCPSCGERLPGRSAPASCRGCGARFE